MNAPKGKWVYYGFKDDDPPRHIFVLENLEDEFFNHCILISVVNGGCLFSWSEMPTNNLEYFKIAAKIHRCLLGEKDFSMASSITKYTDVLLKGQDRIKIDYEDYKIQIIINSGSYSMTLWTPLGKTDFINKML